MYTYTIPSPIIPISHFPDLPHSSLNQKSLLLQAALTIPAQLHTTELAVLTANALHVNARNLVLYPACNPIEAPWSLIRAAAWDCTALTMADEMRRHVDADYFAVRCQLVIFLGAERGRREEFRGVKVKEKEIGEGKAKIGRKMGKGGKGCGKRKGGHYRSKQNSKPPQSPNPKRKQTPQNHTSHPDERKHVKDERDVELQVKAFVKGVLDGGWEVEG
jgi:hypothetical protein